MRNWCFDHVWCLRVGNNYCAKCQHAACVSLHRHCRRFTYCTLWGTFWRSHGPDRIASHCHSAEWSTGGDLTSICFFSSCKTSQSLGQPTCSRFTRRCSQQYTHPWLGGNPPGLTKYRSWSIHFDQCLVWSADMLSILIQSHDCWGGDTRRDQDLDWRPTCAPVGVVLLGTSHIHICAGNMCCWERSRGLDWVVLGGSFCCRSSHICCTSLKIKILGCGHSVRSAWWKALKSKLFIAFPHIWPPCSSIFR